MTCEPTQIISLIGVRCAVAMCSATAVFLVGLTAAGRAEASGLKNFVTDLYGGQGISIFDPGEGIEVLGINNASISAFGTLNSSITSNLGANALTSAVTSSLFDVTQGMPVSVTESLGPLVGERAETLGAGKFDFGASFSDTNFTRLNNAPLNQLTAVATRTDCAFGTFSCDDEVLLALDLKIERQTEVFAASYGVTSNWDIGLVLPIVQVTARASANARLNDTGHDGDTFLNGTLTNHASSGGSASGVGDILLRSKYNFLRDQDDFPDLAIFGQVKLPSGDENNFLGSGSTDFLGEVVLSKQLGRVAPHLNLGYEVASGGSDRNNLRYVVGADVRITDDLTGAVDAVGEAQQGGVDTADASIGIRWRPFNNAVIGANLLVPINKDVGLRPDVGWAVSVDIPF